MFTKEFESIIPKKYVTVDDMKGYLYIDLEGDEELLEGLIMASEVLIQNYLGRELAELECEEDVLNPALVAAIKIQVANMYNSRESVSFGSAPQRIPYSLEMLIQPFKKYDRPTATIQAQLNQIWAALYAEYFNRVEVNAKHLQDFEEYKKTQEETDKAQSENIKENTDKINNINVDTNTDDGYFE